MLLSAILLYMERFVQNMEQHAWETEAHALVETATPMVERAFQLLDLLMITDEGLGLSELARALSMSKGSMHRLLKTLEHCGAVTLNEERYYVLGPRIYKLAAYVRGTGLRRLALPAMQRLVPRIGETLFLGRVEQEHVHVIETVEAGGEHLYPHISVPRGTLVPLPQGSSGALYSLTGRKSNESVGSRSMNSPVSQNLPLRILTGFYR